VRAIGAFVLVLTACGGGDGAPAGPADGAPPVEAGPPDPALEPGPETPPRGRAALEPWLDAGSWRAWACERDISQPRLTGNHGRHRICSNARLVASVAGAYPVGAASVKELFGAGTAPNGYAVGLKVEAGEGGQTWYWYERRGADAASGRVIADGVNLPDCSVCHGTAVRDYVFITAGP
jgi:hypothetical protein